MPYFGYNPVILTTLEAIAVFTGVGTDTVKQWLELGAPIAVEKSGSQTRYSAELAALQDWRLKQSRKRAELERREMEKKLKRAGKGQENKKC